MAVSAWMNGWIDQVSGDALFGRLSERIGPMSQRWEQHPGEDSLEAYALGQLQGMEGEQVEFHLLLCGRCQRRLAELDAFVATLREVTPEPAASSLDALGYTLATRSRPPADVLDELS
jgi:hypothetical protein